jgi:hypothetical protein
MQALKAVHFEQLHHNSPILFYFILVINFFKHVNFFSILVIFFYLFIVEAASQIWVIFYSNLHYLTSRV